MVCKEEIFIWFKSLKGSKRIEVICGLLNMCCPLELRFCGTCLEELASHDFFSLKDDETRANNVQELLKIKNVQDSHTRSRLLVYLSLLHGSNTMCSNSMFKLITEEVKIDALVQAGVLSDPKFIDEIFLLLTMAAHHPAFSYEQQNYMQELCSNIDSYIRQAYVVRDEVIQDDSGNGLGNLLPTMGLMSPVFIPEPHVCNNTPVCHHHSEYEFHSLPKASEISPSQSQIASLKVKPSNKKMSVRIRVSLTSNKIVDIFKTPYEIAAFHQKIIQLFPHETYSPNKEKCIPYLPDIILTCTKQDVLNENLSTAITDYISQLNSLLPSHIMQSDHVVNFFLSSAYNRSGMTRNVRNSDDLSKNSRLRSITIYNSHISESSPTKRIDSKQQSSPLNALHRKVPENGVGLQSDQSAIISMNSPLHSPLNSPYMSPTNSETNSRSASPWVHRFLNDHSSNMYTADTCTLEKLLIKEQLYEYWDILRNYRIEELQILQIEELECIGLLKDAAVKLRRLLDTFRSFLPSNGLDNAQAVCRNSLLNVQVTMKSNLPLHEVSNESSPTGSEPCSPPQSPSPSEICNHTSSSNSSSEEVVIDKGTPSKIRNRLSEIGEPVEQCLQDTLSKRSEEVFIKNGREAGGWNSVPSMVQLPLGYTSTVPQMSPLQHQKLSFVPVQCRTNTGMHVNPGRVIFDKQFSRVPLPSALTFLPHASPSTTRSLVGTPDGLLTSATSGLPITSLCPFPVVTSGSATVPSPTCSFASNKSANVTVVTNSTANGVGSRQFQKGSQPLDSDISSKVPLLPQALENLYSPNCAYLLTSSNSSGRPNIAPACTCLCTGNVPRPSPTPSPSLSPASTPQQPPVPVSLPLYGLPYLFPHSIPFLPNHSGAPANGFIQPPTLPTLGHGFTYALPNGMSPLSPEMLYGAQTFVPQSASSSQTAPSMVTPSATQCYASYQPAANTNTLNNIAHAIKVATCYNCGKVGHRGMDCKEQNIDEMNKAKYQLHYGIAQKLGDSND